MYLRIRRRDDEELLFYPRRKYQRDFRRNPRGGIGFFSCWQCEGAGVVQGEYPVTIAFPAGIVGNHVIQVPLERFGITNFYLNMIFRVGE